MQSNVADKELLAELLPLLKEFRVSNAEFVSAHEAFAHGDATLPQFARAARRLADIATRLETAARRQMASTRALMQ